MNRGRVIGTVWATRMAPGLRGQKLALVDLGGDRLVVAADTMDARNGDRVLVSWGSGARNVLVDRPGDPDRSSLALTPAGGVARRLRATSMRHRRSYPADPSSQRSPGPDPRDERLTPGPDNRAVLCDAAISQVIDGSSDDQEG